MLAKIGLDLPLQGCDLLVQRDQDRDQGADRRGVGSCHDVGLAQVGGAQHSLDLAGLRGDMVAAGALKGGR
ncbi:MAG: hypothetical protein ACM3ML_19670 [Micromonosporaceae bacterium]